MTCIDQGESEATTIINPCFRLSSFKRKPFSSHCAEHPLCVVWAETSYGLTHTNAHTHTHTHTQSATQGPLKSCGRRGPSHGVVLGEVAELPWRVNMSWSRVYTHAAGTASKRSPRLLADPTGHLTNKSSLSLLIPCSLSVLISICTLFISFFLYILLFVSVCPRPLSFSLSFTLYFFFF